MIFLLYFELNLNINKKVKFFCYKRKNINKIEISVQKG